MNYLILIKMNKYGFYLFFLLAISFTKSEEIDEMDKLYYNFTIIAKGMTETTEYKCSNTLIAHKKTLFPVTKAIINNIFNQQELEKIMTAAALPILMIPQIVENCNINSNYEFVRKFLNDEGFIPKVLSFIIQYNQLSNETALISFGKKIKNETGISFK